MNCVICLEDLNQDKHIVSLKCGHKYHGGCIVSWMERGGRCPICRADSIRCYESGGGSGDGIWRENIAIQEWLLALDYNRLINIKTEILRARLEKIEEERRRVQESLKQLTLQM
jgi:hypothetical protein